MNPTVENRNRSAHQKFHSVSHDLREPARKINQFLKLLKMKTGHLIDEDSLQYLNFALSASDSMDKMIKGLTAAYAPPLDWEEKSSVNVKDLVMRSFHKKLEQGVRNAQLKFEGDEIGVVRAMVIKEVVEEIIINSLQHAQTEGDLMILVKGASTPEGYSLEIQDNGEALTSFWREKAFMPFKKRDINSKNLGIGLTKVKELISNYNGNIYFDESNPEVTKVNCIFT